jgi:hypothetical protein
MALATIFPRGAGVTRRLQPHMQRVGTWPWGQSELRRPGFVQLSLFEQPGEQARAVARLKREVNGTVGRFALRSGATLPLADVYRDQAQDYDICDVRGKVCF